MARGPRGFASVRPHGDGLRFESCDPGKRARKGTGGSRDALQARRRARPGSEPRWRRRACPGSSCAATSTGSCTPYRWTRLTTDADVPGLEARVTEPGEGLRVSAQSTWWRSRP
ncbi:hypothetical protein G5V59_25030 [Nocardioides sp. W3-2-3]|uniref:hypothetical protein n=1 Tax=Nocardioides convexus TaxID=2712224 RepID=UPI0024184A55|nr:hypothetical protein [Nocardioides convexus]NHA01825.1 hypothetical protein [Nocardioides convexus]